MADKTDKVKDAIDNAADKAKSGVEKASDKASDAAKAVGNKLKETGQKVTAAVEFKTTIEARIIRWAGRSHDPR